jgi:long-chain acyl-CoA synthetase
LAHSCSLPEPKRTPAENTPVLVHHALQRAVQRHPKRPAIIDEGETLTYGDLWDRVELLAVSLRDLVTAESRVVISLSDKPGYITAFYAVSLAGGVSVPLADGASEPTVARIVRDCEPEAVLTTAGDLAHLSEDSVIRQCRIVDVEPLTPAAAHGSGSGRERSSGPSRPSVPEPAVTRDSPALILYTSGTTAKQKGVLLSHRNLLQATQNINEFMQIDPEIRECVTVPLTHSFGFGRVRCVFDVGGRLVLQPSGVSALGAIQGLKNHGCNALSWVPAGFALCLKHFEKALRQFGGQVRWIEFGSAPMPLEHKHKLIEIFPNARICMHYGLTEASRSTFMEFHTDRLKLETVGRPSPNVDVRIADEDGRLLPPSEPGEIWVRGEHVAAGYWRDEELTARAFAGEGYLRTGDFGFVDADGYVSLLGRKDDMINMGGINISPLEVEEAIRLVYPGLVMCVVGVPDPEGVSGSIPALCYVGGHSDELTLPALHHALDSRLDRTKLPRAIFKLDRLPQTESGKIRRKEVQKLLRSYAT